MIPAARASPRTLIMVRNLSLEKEPEALAITIFWRILMLCFHIFWFWMFLCQDLLLNIRLFVELKSAMTYRIQSMATISVMSSGGSPTEVRTITIVTRPA